MSDDTKVTFEYVKAAIESGDQEKLEVVLLDFIRFLREERPEKWAKLMESGITVEEFKEQTRTHLKPAWVTSQLNDEELKFQEENQ
jgi:inhibitor of KinA sporulation pathway (predicted exonuclease)